MPAGCGSKLKFQLCFRRAADNPAGSGPRPAFSQPSLAGHNG